MLPQEKKLLLSFYHIGGLRPAGTVHYIKFYLLPFCKGLKPLFLDCRVMNKDISTIFPFDKPITLFLIEPLHATLHSKLFLPKKKTTFASQLATSELIITPAGDICQIDPAASNRTFPIKSCSKKFWCAGAGGSRTAAGADPLPPVCPRP